MKSSHSHAYNQMTRTFFGKMGKGILESSGQENERKILVSNELHVKHSRRRPDGSSVGLQVALREGTGTTAWVWGTK